MGAALGCVKEPASARPAVEPAKTEASDSSKPKVFTLQDVAPHNKPYDLWIAIDGKVYDVTAFINRHPGGPVIVEGGGKDSSAVFVSCGHSNSARKMLQQYYIGDLKA